MIVTAVKSTYICDGMCLAESTSAAQILFPPELKKDPGIPNLYPFKEQLLQQIEDRRQQVSWLCGTHLWLAAVGSSMTACYGSYVVPCLVT